MTKDDGALATAARMIAAGQELDPRSVTTLAPGIPLWPGTAPGSEGWEHQESVFVGSTGALQVRNVVVPTLTPYLPDPERATGAAVIVAPGGGFLMLSMESEGTAVAEWLRERGIAAFLLKYRVGHSGATMADFAQRFVSLFEPVTAGETVAGSVANMDHLAPGLALDDTRRAMALVRERAAEWQIDSDRIGLIGFSAGAFLASNAVDAKDPVERPDFIACIYGGYAEDKTAPDDAPPLFAVVTADDVLCFDETVRLIQAWQSAGRPVEAHLYPIGGHGFGCTPTGEAADSWLDRFEEWLRGLGHLGCPQ
ncbi:alpha/beta hydrolase [Streptomyces caeruleatus]|uniref:BD-FAE-like domain-containing protein n=1 Tax=Streptomyces caeruleatus TaxID=661399 RepID=A0A101U7L4_9ACTN|nr:alpha/beta hydrolase [Streptomyces caeruleatus]KUO05543.1 hypothetical protein AQJ67_05170 [Streptomyces caeruleatus]